MNAKVCRVMIASPSDVKEERGLIREVISEWNSVNSERNKFVLLPVGWETHTSPDMGERPQAIINKDVLRDCDLLVAAFWTRIGSPTGSFPSGSVEEIEEDIASGRDETDTNCRDSLRAQSLGGSSLDTDCQTRCNQQTLGSGSTRVQKGPRSGFACRLADISPLPLFVFSLLVQYVHAQRLASSSAVMGNSEPLRFRHPLRAISEGYDRAFV